MIIPEVRKYYRVFCVEIGSPNVYLHPFISKIIDDIRKDAKMHGVKIKKVAPATRLCTPWPNLKNEHPKWVYIAGYYGESDGKK